MSSVTVLFPTGPAFAQAPQIDQVALEENLHWFRPDTPIGNQSSLILISDEAALLVDTNIDSVAPALRAFLDQHANGRPWIPVTSHHHGDHTQGLEHFGRDVFSIAPTTQRDRLETTPLTTPDSPHLIAGALPLLALEGRATLHLGDETIELLRSPVRNSHTDGDVFVYFKRSGVLYVGDHYFADRLPLIDFSGGGSIDGFLATLRWIESEFPQETRIIPGHGLFAPAAPRVDALPVFSSWVRKVERAVAAVQHAVDAGLSVEGVVETGLPPDLKEMGERPRYISEERWIRALYAELRRTMEKP